VRRKFLIAAGVIVGVLLVTLIGLLLYIEFGDLNRHSATVTRLISDALGREIRIGGRFEPSIGLTTTLVAEDISLANPEWSVEPAMVHADHLAVTFDLLSLFSDEIRIDVVEATGARVVLEVDGEGRASWQFRKPGPAKPGSGKRKRLRLAIERATIDDFEFRYHHHDWDNSIDVALSRAEIRSDAAGMMGVDFLGRFDDAPLRITGELGPFNELIAGADVEHDLTGSIGDVEIVTRGRVERLAKLGNVDLSVTASGPNLAATGSLINLGDLPEDPFDISGRMLWSGFPCTFENVEIRVGDNTVSLEGVLGKAPDLLDTDFTFAAKGPDLSSLGVLAGVTVPPESFRATGRVVRLERGIAVENVDAKIGETQLRIDGIVGDPPEYVDTDLQLRAEGPDLSVFRDLVGIDLPRESFEVEGRLGDKGPAISLESVRARLGNTRVSVDGTLDLAPGLVGTDLRVSANGPDLAAVAIMVGIPEVPSEPFRVEGDFGVLASGYALRRAEARVGDVTMNAHGKVGPLPETVGTDLDFVTEGPDLSYVGTLVGRTDLPVEPFRVEGGVAVLESGYELRAIDAHVGDLAVKTEGHLGPLPELDGTSLRAEAHLPDLSALGRYVDRTLPEEPAAVLGSVTVEGDSYLLRDLVIELGAHRLGAEGTLVATEGLIGTDLVLDVAVPDLSEIDRFVAEADHAEPRGLPAQTASFSGRVSVHEEGYRLHGVEVGIREGVAQLDGLIGRPPGFVGTDLTVNAQGPDGLLVDMATDFEVPPSPLNIRGRVERLEQGFRFHDVAVQYGEYDARANGMLGEPPKFVGTDLDVHAKGPSLEFIGSLAGYPDLPDASFSISGKFEGTPTQFSVPRLEARLGPSDLSGSFTVDLRGKPDLQGRFTSRLLDLRERLEDRKQAAKQEEAGGESKLTQKEIPGAGDRVISDEPFDLEVLQRVNADLRWTIDEIVLTLSRLHDFDLGIHLVDGRVDLDPIAASVDSGGDLVASVALEPNGDGVSVGTNLRVDRFLFNLASDDTDPSSWTPFDVELELDAEGRSPHELASTVSGEMLVTVGAGRMDNSLIDLIVADILVKLLEALNPFRKEEPYTRIECGIFSARFTDGVARLEPLALQTDKMTMIGDGWIRFESEKLSLDWVTKPRKGIGLSASTFTNPYIKLGGTLASPNIEMKPLDALATTGAAVATAGLALLARGMWDRITAEQNACAHAVKKMEKQVRKEQKKAGN